MTQPIGLFNLAGIYFTCIFKVNVCHHIEPREMHVFIEREKLHIGIGKHVVPNKFEINPDSSSSKSLLPIDNIYPLVSQVEDSPN